MLLNVLGCRLTYEGQVVTSAEAWFSNSLRPRKPEGSLGRTAQDGHLDSHTAPELWPGFVSLTELSFHWAVISMGCNFNVLSSQWAVISVGCHLSGL